MPPKKEENTRLWYGFAGAFVGTAWISFLYIRYKKKDQKGKAGFIQTETCEKIDQKKNQYTSEENNYISCDTKVKGIKEQVREDVSISREKLIRLLNEWAQGTQTIINHLATEEQRLSEKNLEETQIMESLHTYYEQEIENMKINSLKKYNMTSSECSQSLEMYKNDSEVLILYTRIEQINATLMGTPASLTKSQLALIPESLTIDRLIELCSELVKVRQCSILEAQMNFDSSHETTLSTLVGKIYQEKISELKRNFFEKFGITEEILDLALQKYLHHPKLQNALVNFPKSQENDYQNHVQEINEL